MKTISIHQPNFIPWLGYFYKIARSDVFVILDDVQFTKNSFINRNKIKTPQGAQWLTVPVKQSGKHGQLISETEITNNPKSLRKILKTVEQNYKKARYFDEYFESFYKSITEDAVYISELNGWLIRWAMEILDIQTEVITSSEFGTSEFEATERLVYLCKQLGGDQYFSGFGGMNYQEEEAFKSENIDVVVSDFQHPVYEQLWGDFMDKLSIIDLIFNCGPESRKTLLNESK